MASAASTMWRRRAMAAARPLDTNGFAHNGRADRLAEPVFGDDIHGPTEEILKVNLKSSKVEQRPAGLERDQEVHIAVGHVLAASHRAEDPHVPSTVRRRGRGDHVP